jgi:hypothetical protein
MSFDYWHMKLQGGYVHHEGKVKIIEELHFDEDKWENDAPKGRFPEDYLPYITFHLSGGSEVAYGDFEIKFPNDQWYLTEKKKASLLQRRMTRQYKIAPTSELYEVMHEESMSTILDKCDNMEYNPPTDLFNWSQEDKVFNPKVSLVRTGHKKRVLYYNSTPIANMTRGREWIKLDSLVKKLPSLVDGWWGSQMGVQIPSPVDATDPLGADLTNMMYAWRRYERMPAAPDTSHSYVTYRNTPLSYISFHMTERKYGIVRREDVELLFCDALISRAERQDMVKIFDEEIGEAA